MKASRSASIKTALELRDQLLKDESWYSSEQVATRAIERMLGVRFRNNWKYPVFQFVQGTGEPHMMMTEILARLPLDDSGWTATFWFFMPHGRLGGNRPADILHADILHAEPEAVLYAAEKDFAGDDGI